MHIVEFRGHETKMHENENNSDKNKNENENNNDEAKNQTHTVRAGNSAGLVALPYLTLPPGWTGSYTCPALRLYQLGPMRIPECN